MRCQCLFCGKNKKNSINRLSTEFTQRVVKTNQFMHEYVQWNRPSIVLKESIKIQREHRICRNYNRLS